MSHTAIGIGDIALYLPDPNMDMQTLMESRSKSNPQLVRSMNRAIEHTGQLSFRFPEPWEDTASMAANSAAEIMPNPRHPTFRVCLTMPGTNWEPQ